HLLFWNHEERQYDFSRNSDQLTVINESTVPVKVRITARVSGMGDAVLSQNEDFSEINGCAVYLALTDDEGNELPLTEDGEVSMEVEMQKVPDGAYTWLYNDRTDQYEYGYVAKEGIEFDKYSFGLHGECNTSDAWGKVAVAPKVTVTWNVESVMPGEENTQDRETYDTLFADLSEQMLERLPLDKRRYAERVSLWRDRVHFAYQNAPLGFGHAVYQAREFTQGEPVLLLLGDMIYQSARETNCCRQIMDAYMECGQTMVGLQEVPLSNVVHYGILAGQWVDEEQALLQVSEMSEKPTTAYAQEQLGVSDANGEMHFFATFGQYILPPVVFEELEHLIREDRQDGGEIQLTAALESVRARDGLVGILIQGTSYDIGQPDTYRRTVAEYGLCAVPSVETYDEPERNH
ncbi:MAG: hypothetical protein IJT34_00810, partial [Butyrivibrio sp.]|nr:hypothetical protein [Butyrivibrio sp.]